MGMIPIRRALLSVTDKTGLVELAGDSSPWHRDDLHGGTAAALRKRASR